MNNLQWIPGAGLRGNVGNEANREITRKQILPAATLGKSCSGKFMEKIGGKSWRVLENVPDETGIELR